MTRAAVLYVFRCLVGDDIPLNDGCLKPLKLIIPPGTFLSPRPGAAVVAGNTEVSQATCNALFGALGAIACSQATMNNFLFGDAHRQYYETICGGTGAGPGFDGTSAVHTAHDQHADDRSRRCWNCATRCGWNGSRSAAARAATANGAAATARSGGSGSWSR